ncbi:substrate-binding domain-containing protein [Aureivirga marina]|uniref:substrate-binding domain-containing protein n=1 Tax=Aureivirga marina TaxID=1182451 RepID=UPI0018CA8181|nr:substrate-binding domain-containing protein [Aureivirga marina]
MKNLVYTFLIISLIFSTSCKNQSKEENLSKTEEKTIVRSKRKDNSIIRLATVNTPDYSGLIDYLLPQFEEETGLKVELYSGSDVYLKAMEGEADLVISHFGKHGVEEFVSEGWGTWPEMVFANQAVIIGPKSDPAGIKGIKNASEALKKIAETNSIFINNAIPGVSFLADIFWDLAGNSEKGNWYLKEPVAMKNAAKLANEKNGYFIWGASPFLKYDAKEKTNLEILVAADPMFQRRMSITLVQNEKVEGVNTKGAELLRNYLLRTDTQAKIAKFRSKWSDLQLWWPAARDN